MRTCAIAVCSKMVDNGFRDIRQAYQHSRTPVRRVVQLTKTSGPYRSLNKSLNPTLTHLRSPLRPFNLTPSLTSLFTPAHRCLSPDDQFCRRTFGGRGCA